MAITPATVTFSLYDFLGFVPDVRRTKVILTTNVESGFIVDTTTGGGFRITDVRVTIDSTGLVSFSILPSGATGLNPAEYQIRVRIDAENKATRQRTMVDLGWYTITASCNLKDEAEGQYVPPTYLGQAIETLQGYVDEGADLLAQQEEISGLANSDAAQAYNVEHGPLTAAALSASTEDLVVDQGADPSTPIGGAIADGSEKRIAEVPVRRRSLPRRQTALPSVMITAPVVTVSAAGAGSTLTNPKITTLLSGALPLSGSVADFAALGDGANYATGKPNGTGSDRQYALLRMPFDTDAPKIEIVFWDNTQSFTYKIRVNGEYVATGFPAFAYTGAAADRRLTINFGSRKWREIVVETQNAAIKSVVVGTIDTIRAGTPRPYRMGFLMDSYGVYGAQLGIAATACDLLGVTPFIDASGGTGYLATAGTGNNRLKFGDRMTSLLSANLDAIVFCGGVNDFAQGKNVALTVAAAQACWQAAINDGIPPEQIWVLSPYYTPSYGSPTALRDALKTAAQAMGLNFIDALAEGWVTGTGKAGALTGDGNADVYIDTDGVHPITPDGFTYYGVRLAAAIIATSPR